MITFLEWLNENAASVQSFTLNDVNPEWIYNIFKTSYEKSTGQSWSYQTFLGRASNWTFYGLPPQSDNDPNAGFVAVRIQNSGLIKLTGVAGNGRGILRGVDMLNSLNKPIWGAVSGDIAAMAAKKGFKIIPPFILKMLAAKGVKIPGMEIDSAGNIKADIVELGTVDKKAIVNDQYINWLKKQYPDLPITNDLGSGNIMGMMQNFVPA